MTVRSIIIGLIGGVAIAGGGYLNDQVLGLESVVAGHLLPIIVMGTLIPVMVVLNPLLGRAGPRWALRPAEVAVIVAMMTIGCSVPVRGMMETFIPVMVMPAHWYQTRPGWQEQGLMDYIPDRMLAGGGQYLPRLQGGFTAGLGTEGQWIGLGDVPWDLWTTPLTTWLPMVALLTACVICLGLIVHRQWSQNERLRYPIAEFAASLMAQDRPGGLGPIYRRKGFWIGLAIVLGIRVMNGLDRWYPESIEFPLYLDFRAIGQQWPEIARAPWAGGVLRPNIFPMVVAFSFFIASDISLSMGLSQPLLVLLAMVLVEHGVDISSTYMAGGATAWQRFGSYLAMALIIAYIGRRYYADVLARAVLGRTRAAPAYAAWACRVLIVASVTLTALLIGTGLDWTLAVLMVAMMLLMFLGVSRIAAETGLFFIQPRWQPLGIFLGLLGGYALGPQALMIVGMLCTMLCLDPSQSLMPYFVNGLRLCELNGVRPSRLTVPAGAVWTLGVAIAVPVVLWANYNFGLRQAGWPYRRVPTMTFRTASTELTQVAAARELDASRSLSPIQRLTHMRPDRRFAWFAGGGFVAVLVVSALRLRYTWWPLHPVMFLLWATWPMREFSFSFLLGWAIKTAITRLGSHRVYANTKPLMIGIIAGDLLGGLIFMMAGAIYYARTGLEPIAYRILPK